TEFAGPTTDLLCYELDDGSTIAIRPSGTEPKLKLYGEMFPTLSPSSQNIGWQYQVKRAELGLLLGVVYEEFMRA
ncbi:MAG: hypothetical protein KDD53_09225, partial [Bdellovibrionales bacterium]|nr:hypothetical protein [Bdellovibrionales bacterium]